MTDNSIAFVPPEKLFSEVETLRDIARELEEFGAAIAAEETEETALVIMHSIRQIRVRQRRLEKVWRAVQRLRSMDGGPSALRLELKHYGEIMDD